jgi:hypothetical protein
MLSRLKPGFLYTDIAPDIAENDFDVVADTWEMDGREVYRGTRDMRYDHANVFWLYDDALERVGCVEHNLADHADFTILWFQDSEFGTLVQEDGWNTGDDLWSKIPRRVFDRFVNEGWTTPETFLEHCLDGPVRIVTPSMVLLRPVMYTCERCGKKSLRKDPRCTMLPGFLDFPDKAKTFFIDFDFVVHTPPSISSVWSRLIPPPDDDSSQEPVQEPVQEPKESPHREPTPPPAAPHPPDQDTPGLQTQTTEEQVPEQAP